MSASVPPVKTLVADPKWGSFGILIHQTKSTVYSNPGNYYLYQISELYLQRISWDERHQEYNNRTNNDLELETTKSSSIHASNTVELAAKLDLSLKFEGIGFSISGEAKSLWSHSSSSMEGETYKVTLRSGETLHRYSRVHKLVYRTWWIVDMQNIRRVLTDQKDKTIAVEIDTAVIKDLWASLTRLTGEAPLNVVPLVKRWDDSDGACPRTVNTTLPGDLQEGINRCVQAAKGK